VGRIPAHSRRSRDLIGAEASLLSLLAASFLASTLIPISSEAALFAVLKLHAELAWPAIQLGRGGPVVGCRALCALLGGGAASTLVS